MAQKDNIAEHYRRQVDELLDSRIGSYLPFLLSQKEQDNIWEEISTDLDIGEVWEDISSDLDRMMPLHHHSDLIVRSFAALLIIAIGIIPVKKEILNSDREQPDVIVNHQQIENKTDQFIKNKSADSNTGEQVNEESAYYFRSITDKGENRTGTTPAIESRTAPIHPIKGTSSDIDVKVIYMVNDITEVNETYQPSDLQEIHVDGSGGSPALFTDQMEPAKMPSDINADRLKINSISTTTGLSLPSSNNGRISMGMIALFKNTWLLNYETFDGYNPESLHTTVIVFFPDAGLSFNYLLNNNWTLQGDGFFFSNTGQEYLQFDKHGHYSRKTITLNYSTIVLSVKYKFTGKKVYWNHFSLNLIAGSYLSFLHHADQKSNADVEDIGSQYSKFDYGVKLGSELELRFSDHFSVAMGPFLSYGIPNIYKGNDKIPDYFRKTYNGFAGIQLAFYYSL